MLSFLPRVGLSDGFWRPIPTVGIKRHKLFEGSRQRCLSLAYHALMCEDGAVYGT